MLKHILHNLLKWQYCLGLTNRESKSPWIDLYYYNLLLLLLLLVIVIFIVICYFMSFDEQYKSLTDVGLYYNR